MRWGKHSATHKTKRTLLRHRRFPYAMLLLTAEGTRSIDDALILCIDGYRGNDEHSYVTVYLLTGEQVTGIVAKTEVDDLDPIPMP